MPLMSDDPPSPLPRPHSIQRLFICGSGSVSYAQIVAPSLQRIREHCRHLGAEVEAIVRTARFEQQHGDIRVLRQARREHVARRSRTNDDIVVFVRAYRFDSFKIRADTGRVPPEPDLMRV